MNVGLKFYYVVILSIEPKIFVIRVSTLVCLVLLNHVPIVWPELLSLWWCSTATSCIFFTYKYNLILVSCGNLFISEGASESRLLIRVVMHLNLRLTQLNSFSDCWNWIIKAWYQWSMDNKIISRIDPWEKRFGHGFSFYIVSASSLFLCHY